MSNKDEKKHDELENVEHALTASEVFIEKYQKQIIYSVGAIVLIVLLILSVRNFYLKPREISAQNEMYKAQNFFAQDSFKVALEGDGINFIGFKEISSNYSFTASANLASAYAGICYYKLGQYDNAIKYLSKFDAEKNYFSLAVVGLIGDSYVELGETTKAIGYFEKAAYSENEVISPVYLKKAGLVYESLKDLEAAEKCYTTIKDKYPKSTEASDIEKYIARIQK